MKCYSASFGVFCSAPKLLWKFERYSLQSTQYRTVFGDVLHRLAGKSNKPIIVHCLQLREKIAQRPASDLSLALFDQAVENLIKDNIDPDEKFYSTAITGFTKRDRTDLATSLLLSTKYTTKSPTIPKPSSMRADTLLYTLATKGNAERVDSVLKRMKELQFRFDHASTFVSLISGFRESKDRANIEKYIGDLEAASGIETLDVRSFVAIVKALAFCQQTEKAMVWIEKMHKNRYDVGAACFHLFLELFAYNPAEAMETWTSLKEKYEFRSSTQDYTVMLSKIVSERNFALVEPLYQLVMKENDLNKDLGLYTSLISTLISARKQDAVDTLFEEMNRDFCVPDDRFFNRIIKTYCEVNDLDHASQVLDVAVKNNPNFRLSVNTKKALKALDKHRNIRAKHSIAFI